MFALLVALASLVIFTPFESGFLWLAEAMRSAGLLGLVAYALLYILASLMLLPAALLSMLAGFVYGPALGFCIALPAATLAAAVTHVVVRRVGRRFVEQRVQGHPRWAAIDRATESQGLKLVLLLRLSPIVPFALLNYLAGASRIRLSHFVFGSFVGKAPSLLLHVYASSAVSHVTQLKAGAKSADPASEALFWFGLLATVVATWQLARIATQKSELLLADSESAPLRREGEH